MKTDRILPVNARRFVWRCLLIATISLTQAPRGVAELVRETYPGKLVRTETVSIVSNPFTEVAITAPVGSHLAFQFTRHDRREFLEKPIYEKIIVERDPRDIDHPGTRIIVPDQFIPGDVRKREELIEIGPIADAPFRYLDTTAATDNEGILVDRDQEIMRLFDDLKLQKSDVTFVNSEHGGLTLAITREDIYESFRIDYTLTNRSDPSGLQLKGEWDLQRYRSGQDAWLTVTAVNSSTSVGVYLLLARSISRWSWLDGKMYYLGDLEPGKTVVFKRLFSIPRDAAPGIYYMRVGARDFSGSKPFLPLTLVIEAN